MQMSNQDSNHHAFDDGVLEAPGAQTVEKTEELERVREIILGPDAARRKLRQAEVDRLREIIFGAQMEEYARHFADFQRESERLRADLRALHEQVSDLERSQARRIEALEQETRRLNDTIQREIERQRSREVQLQQLITQARQQEVAAQSLTDQIGDLRKTLLQYESTLRTLSSAANDYREQNERKLQALKREFHQYDDDLRAELRRFVDRLEQQKTDRKALASMLIEVATRLETGNSVTNLLDDLTSNTKE